MEEGAVRNAQKEKLMPVESTQKNHGKIFYCKHCLKIFFDSPSVNRIFCSNQCRHASRRLIKLNQRIKLKCDSCKRLFYRFDEHQRRFIRYSPKSKNKLNFCSVQCRCEYWSKNIYQWRNDSRGENNPAWRGGVSPKRRRIEATKKYKYFIQRILLRDNHKCRVCPIKNRLEVHHIIPFHKNKSLFLKESNALTLCHKHHNQTKFKEHLYITIFNDALRGKSIVDRFTKMTGKAPVRV